MSDVSLRDFIFKCQASLRAWQNLQSNTYSIIRHFGFLQLLMRQLKSHWRDASFWGSLNHSCRLTYWPARSIEVGINPNEIEGIYVRFKETDHYNWIGTHKYLAQRQHTQEVYCQQLVHNCSKITKCITCETWICENC